MEVNKMHESIKGIRNVLVILVIILGFGFIYGFDVKIIPLMGCVFVIFYFLVHIDLTRDTVDNRKT